MNYFDYNTITIIFLSFQSLFYCSVVFFIEVLPLFHKVWWLIICQISICLALSLSICLSLSLSFFHLWRSFSPVAPHLFYCYLNFRDEALPVFLVIQTSINLFGVFLLQHLNRCVFSPLRVNVVRFSLAIFS